MLYERWRQVARENPSEWALIDRATGRRWTFAQLASAADAENDQVGKVVFPQGTGADFIPAVLAAWRNGRVVCPLEPGQTKPEISALPPRCVHVKTTSASTGAARAVLFTGEQLLADAENIVATMGMRRDWPNLGAISLAHSYGFSNLVLPLLLFGIPLISVPAPLPETIRKAAGQADAVTLPAVPALWRTWNDAGVIPPNLRLAISAGAPLPLALEAEVFERHGIKIHNFYGATECGGIAYDTTTQPRADATCVGAPMCNVTLAVGADGCLQVRGGAVGTSYWPEPDCRLADGCFQTSDLAEIVGGQVYLRGRAGDVINVAGRKISPETIERELLAHPAVRECLVFGVPNGGGREEIIVACVEAQQEAAFSDLRGFLLKRLPAWQVPREWWLVDSLSANNRGKRSRAEWRKRYLEGKRASG